MAQFFRGLKFAISSFVSVLITNIIHAKAFETGQLSIKKLLPRDWSPKCNQVSIGVSFLVIVLCSLFYYRTDTESVLAASYNDNRVLLQDVHNLTFVRGKYTTSRRTHAYPQIECRSGCETYFPESVICFNNNYQHDVI